MAGGKIASVEALRGTAALSVVLFHFTNGEWLPPGILKTIGSYGWLGVEAFFVISGFVIPYAMSCRKFDISADGASYVWRRIVRLEPAYLVTAIVCVFLNYASSLAPGFRGEAPTVRLLYDLALHPLYLVPWFDGNWLNTVFWSLAIEFQYYFLVLALAPLLLSEHLSRVRMALCLVLVGGVMPTDDRLVLHYLPLFSVGFLYFLILTSRISWLEGLAWGAAFIVVGLQTLGIPHMVVAVVTAMSFTLPIRASFPLVWVGAISYSLYLVHVPIGGRVINLMARMPNMPHIEYLVLACATAVTFSVALLLYYFVEKPSLRAANVVSTKAAAETAVSGS